MSFRARKFWEINIRENKQYFSILTLLSKFLFVKYETPHQGNWKCRKNNQKRTFLGVEFIIRVFNFPTRFIAYTNHMVHFFIHRLNEKTNFIALCWVRILINHDSNRQHIEKNSPLDEYRKWIYPINWILWDDYDFWNWIFR